MKPFYTRTSQVVGILGLTGLMFVGCSKSTEQGEMSMPENPTEAASQVEQVFQSAPPELQKAVQVASEGLREADYEKAALSLQAIRTTESLTFEQGMAVHNSMVALEAEMVAAMQAGDPQAKQAYERLKRIKRN
jgi:hypothetical protein